MLSSFALASLVLASAATGAVTPTFNEANPSRPSPVHIAPPPAVLLSTLQVHNLHYQYDAGARGGGPSKFKNMKSILAALPVSAPAVAPGLFARSPFFGGLGNLVPQALGNLGNLGNPLPEWSKPLPPNPKSVVAPTLPEITPTSSAAPVATAKPGGSLATTDCLNSTATDKTINSLLFYGGAGAIVFLCPGARITIMNAIFFSAANQTLATLGYPTGDSRGMLIIAGPTQSCAIYGEQAFAFGIALRNIQIDGSRARLGRIGNGLAIVEMGGNSAGQVIDNCRVFDPRGWSCVHGLEGFANSCTNMRITNNQIGPAGNAPSGALQFRKRQTPVFPPGQWADGISLACRNSFVGGNTIVDTTDGGIVVFGAMGSVISGNTIITDKRQGLGGINMVDFAPFAGNYAGTVVEDNTIVAQANFLKVGIAVGPMNWGVNNRTEFRVFSGTVRNNIFKSGSPSGYFQYAIGVAGVRNFTVVGNVAQNANFGGIPSPACFPQFPNPLPQPFVADPFTVKSSTLQSDFFYAPILLSICAGPGAIRTFDQTTGVAPGSANVLTSRADAN